MTISPAASCPFTGSSAVGARPGVELSEEDQEKVRELKERDAEVKRHEEAHLAAAGRYALGGARYEYEKGPDGKRYAVGGEVQLDTSPVPDDPEATIEKARVIRRAAEAPADPSAQDRRVAAEASQMEAEARAEMTKQTGQGYAARGQAAPDTGQLLDQVA